MTERQRLEVMTRALCSRQNLQERLAGRIGPVVGSYLDIDAPNCGGWMADLSQDRVALSRVEDREVRSTLNIPIEAWYRLLVGIQNLQGGYLSNSHPYGCICYDCGEGRKARSAAIMLDIRPTPGRR